MQPARREPEKPAIEGAWVCKGGCVTGRGEEEPTRRAGDRYRENGDEHQGNASWEEWRFGGRGGEGRRYKFQEWRCGDGGRDAV
jgi:hypothetical protein